MPNHTANLLEIKGDGETIQKLIASVKHVSACSDEDDRTFDFNKIVPMPKPLLITSGTSTDYGVAVLDFRKNGNDAKLKEVMGYVWAYHIKTPEDMANHLVEKKLANLEDGQKAIENREKYGHQDWYSWSIANWGTKWNAYDVGDWKMGRNTAELYFETAWSPPLPVIQKLAENFPTLTFKLSYADEGGGFLGYTIFKNGKHHREKEFTWYKNGVNKLNTSGIKLLKKLGRR